MQRHHLDVLSLFSGVVFVAIALIGITDAQVFSAADLRWLGPLAIVGFGIVLVVTSAGSRRDDDERHAEFDGEAEVGAQQVRQDG